MNGITIRLINGTVPTRAIARTAAIFAAGFLATLGTAQTQSKPDAIVPEKKRADKMEPMIAPLDESAIELSPFQVNAQRDDGYVAASTLAGSRLNSELKNTPAAISVFTKDFINDIGATNVTEALQYSLNGQRDYTDLTGLAAVQYSDVNVKMRGFTGATLTRNFFPVLISMDAFNMERIDFSRGPNSILNGIGGPGGSIDTSTKRAHFRNNVNEVQFRVGSWDDYREAIDLNRVLIDKKLAVRVNLMMQDKENWREFDFYDRQSVALALTYRPFKNTEVRLEGEYNKIEQLNSQPWPAADYLTPWVLAGKPIAPSNATSVRGTSGYFSSSLIYDAQTGQLRSWFNTQQTPLTAPASISQPSFPRPILDESILPRSSNLVGPGATTNNESYSYSAFIEQRVGPVILELAANRQSEMRDIRSVLNWNAVALRGDPNPLLPSNVLPNGVVPTGAGSANPDAGKYYVQSTASIRPLDRWNDNLRLTGAYSLDLTKRNPWLGSYNAAALLARNITWQFTEELSEVNLTPPGTTAYPLNLTAAQNAIIRRTYIDFNGNGLRGAIDPWANPIVNVNGVNSGFARTGNTHGRSKITTDSALVAVQAAWLKNRLHVTGGLRRDEQSSLVAGNATQDPVTGVWSRKSFTGIVPVKFAGNTKTFGAVYHVSKELSVFYNKSDNFVGQGSVDFLDRAFGPRKGNGQDMGFRIQLLDNRINFTADYYETDEVNRLYQSTQASSVLQASNAIWRAIGQDARVTLLGNNNDSVDNTAEGWEFELTANPTKNWRVSANLSKGELQQSNTSPRLRDYLQANRSVWQQNTSVALQLPAPSFIPGSNPTVADALAVMDTIYANILLPEGRTPLQFNEYSANLFTSYTMQFLPKWLKGLTLGGGINYRSKPVVGYNTSVTGTPPVLGSEYYLVNGMIFKTFNLGGKKRLKIQLNVDNLLGFDDLLITDKNQSNTYRYQYVTPRRWAVTGTYNF